MRYGIASKVVGLSMAAGMVAAVTLHADTNDVRDQCTATVAEELQVREGEQELRVTLSEEVADSLTAEFAEQSNLRSTGVTKDTEARVVKVKVDASRATAGSWGLTIRAGETACRGEVKVTAAGTPEAR